MRTVLAVLTMLVFAVGLAAEAYEEDYYPPDSPFIEGEEPGDAYPEDPPWNWERYTTGGGAERTAADGVLILEADDPEIADSYIKDKQGELDPGPNEVFYVEWRIRLLPGSDSSDVMIYISSDNGAGDIDLGFATDHIYSYYEYRLTEVDTTVWHTYRIQSINMVDYDLFIDEEYIYTGFFDWPGITSSQVIFGDGVTGAMSSSEWVYFRFGTIRIGDIDEDGVIDLKDFATFAMCFTNGGIQAPPGCTDVEFSLADMEGDGDTDLVDFATFAVNYTG